MCTDWDTVATKQTTASCHAKCSVSVANLKYATGALLEARDIVKCLQVHFAWAQKLAEHVGKFATPFSLDSIDAGLDLRMEGTNAGQGNVPTEMSGKLFGQPYETDFSMDFKNLPLSAHKFFGARIIPAAMSSFGAGASTSTVARGRREKLKAAAIRGNGAFLWGR